MRSEMWFNCWEPQRGGPHTVVPETYEIYWKDIGIKLMKSNSAFHVSEIVQNGPAHRSGKIQKADTLLEVDSRRILAVMSPDDMRMLLMGRKGSIVTLKLLRNGLLGEEIFEVTLQREADRTTRHACNGRSSSVNVGESRDVNLFPSLEALVNMFSPHSEPSGWIDVPCGSATDEDCEGHNTGSYTMQNDFPSSSDQNSSIVKGDYGKHITYFLPDSLETRTDWYLGPSESDDGSEYLNKSDPPQGPSHNEKIVHIDISSPGKCENLSPAASAKGRRLLLSSPLSARGIRPDKHPELHAKMMGEMKRLVDLNCEGSALILRPDAIKCLWCNAIVRCPPYRPQSYYLRGSSSDQPEGHQWTCPNNPNACLQSGQGVPVAQGKVLL